MSDLTPETALAMAHAGAHNEPEHYCRYPSSVTVPAEQMAAEVIRRLLILGFEVRRKDGPRVFGCVCTYEHGDSLCPVHPTCENCGCVTCECTKGGHRVQFHGSVCDEARLARDRDEWKARANKFEAQVEMLEARAEADLINAEAALARATQAEAQAAAMREAARKVAAHACHECHGHAASVNLRTVCRLSDAGRTLLAELEALRALEKTMRDARIAEWHSAADIEVDAAYFRCVQALAAVDAARKGEA